MWHLQQQENSYWHATSLNRIVPQTTKDTPQNGKFYNRSIFELGDETKTFKNMGYEVSLVEIQRITLATEIILGQRNEQ